MFVTPWSVACQAPLSVEILQARILEWGASPFSRGSSRPRNRTWVSCMAGGFFVIAPPGKPAEPNQIGFWELVKTSFLRKPGSQTLQMRTQVLWLLPSTYFSPGVHFLGVGGDAPQALSGGPRRGMALLHQVREVDVAGKAIAVTVARSLLLSGRLGGATQRVTLPLTAQAQWPANRPTGVWEDTQISVSSKRKVKVATI